MSIIVILIPFALLLGTGFALAFVWQAKSGQFEELETPAHRMLLDDSTRKTTHNSKSSFYENQERARHHATRKV